MIDHHASMMVAHPSDAHAASATRWRIPVGLLSFLKKKPEQSAAPVSAAASQPAAQAEPAPQEVARPAVNVILCRSEIVDQRLRLCGYRFAAPSGAGRPPLPEALFFEALVDADVAGFAQRRVALVPISTDAVVFQRHLPVAAPHTIFLIERGQTTLAIDQLAGCMSALRESGAQVALHGVSLEPADAPLLVFFFFNDTATTEIYTLSLHDALPISIDNLRLMLRTLLAERFKLTIHYDRSEEHTSELQSHSDLVCRLLLEKKKK